LQQQQQQPHLQQQQQDLLLPDRRLRPSRMDFAAMLAQLAAWRGRFLTAHVPRHCFDAPELGAWVRHVRKQHAEGRLEQWKVERCVWGWGALLRSAQRGHNSLGCTQLPPSPPPARTG
jgi:hypothetical protein